MMRLAGLRQSGMRVPHYLRAVKTPEVNEEALLNSGKMSLGSSWPGSKSGIDGRTASGGYSVQAMFESTRRGTVGRRQWQACWHSCFLSPLP